MRNHHGHCRRHRHLGARTLIYLMTPDYRIQEVGKKGIGGVECEGSVKDVFVRSDHSGEVAKYTVGGRREGGGGGLSTA